MALTYGVVAWVITQVAETVFPALHLPEWTVTLVVVLCILGFPVALVLAWAYEISPDGIHRDKQDADSPGKRAENQQEDGGGAAARRRSEAWAESGVLPREHTPLVGREAELSELGRLLSSGERLITLIGPGGVGKTRIANAAAAHARARFRDGIHYVPLAGIDSAGALGPTIADHLRLPISSGEGVERQVIDYLREKELLLVLDNFEQIAEGSPFLGSMLDAAARVHLLVTSRERINLQAEVLFPLEGLPCAHGASALRNGPPDAVRLFLQTARRAEPHFEPDHGELECITRICEGVEGIPLAIELAAAWIGTLSCQQIEAEIEKDHDFLIAAARDVPDRHRSLRAVFESSWRLLPEEERRAYRRLSIFRGSFSRDAAAAVAQANLQTLSSLLGRSLLRRSGAEMFETLEVLRQYSWEKLSQDAPEREWTVRLFVRYYTELLDRARGELEGPAKAKSLERLGRELDNIRPAWQEAVDLRDEQAISRSLDVLFAFYDTRGWVQEGQEVFGRALAQFEEGGSSPEGGHGSADPLLVARLRLRHGIFLYHLAQYQEARKAITAAVAELQEGGASSEAALGFESLGHVAYFGGDYEEARRLQEKALEIYQELGEKKASGRLLILLGNIMFSRGDYDGAERLYTESLSILRQLGDEAVTGWPVLSLGIMASVRGEHGPSDLLLLESLEIATRHNNKRLLAASLQNRGVNAYHWGRLEEAESYLRQGSDVCFDMGFRRILALCLNELAQVLSAAGRSAEARSVRRRALSIASEIEETHLILTILVNVARELHEERGESERAEHLATLVLEHPVTDRRAREASETLLESIHAALDDGAELAEPSGYPSLEAAVHEILAEPQIRASSQSDALPVSSPLRQ